MPNNYKIDAKDFDGPVLLTGAGGCIGSWVMSLLFDAGVPVFALDLVKDTRRPKLLMSESELEMVKWFVGDIAEPATIMNAVEEKQVRQKIRRKGSQNMDAGRGLN